MQLLSFEKFAPHLRETFSLSLGESSVDMTLVDATRGRARQIAGLRTVGVHKPVLHVRAHPKMTARGLKAARWV